MTISNHLIKLYRRITTQYKIDNGQIGGLIAVFSSSLIILSPFSFIGILALNYDRYLKYWISLETFAVISVISFILYEWTFFSIIYPSMMQFANRRFYLHDSPMQYDVSQLKITLDKLSSAQTNNNILIQNEIATIKKTLDIILSKKEP